MSKDLRFYAYIRKLMRQKGLTNREMAKALNISTSGFRKIFTRKRGIRDEELKVIARVLGASLQELKWHKEASHRPDYDPHMSHYRETVYDEQGHESYTLQEHLYNSKESQKKAQKKNLDFRTKALKKIIDEQKQQIQELEQKFKVSLEEVQRLEREVKRLLEENDRQKAEQQLEFRYEEELLGHSEKAKYERIIESLEDENEMLRLEIEMMGEKNVKKPSSHWIVPELIALALEDLTE